MASKYISADDVPMFGERVKLHANLNEACLSVQWKDSGGVRWLRDVTIEINEPRFHVQPAGHKRILEKGVRSVVARVSGVPVGVTKTLKTFHNDRLTFTTPLERFGWYEISYNPIERGDLGPHFTTRHDMRPVADGDCSALIVSHNWRNNNKTGVRMWGCFE